MAGERLTFDTNILFYVVDNTAGNKHEISRLLLQSAASKDTVLLLQSLSELYNAVRKRKTISDVYAESFLRTNAALFPTAPATNADLWAGMKIQRDHQIQSGTQCF